ncbi:MAG: hypothetical protein QW717_07225 [Candidatus Bathyarchaeia archaeon]
MTSSSKDRVKRKTFVAREDLIDGLSKVAKEKGYSLYALVNEVFELFLKADESGLDLKNVVEERWIFEAAKHTGFVLGLESLWYEMAELAYEAARDEALKSWFEAGVWLAKRYVAVGEKAQDSMMRFARDLKAFSWNVYEFNIENVSGKVYVHIISPKFSESFTRLFKAFFNGALEGFGYKVVNEEVGRGNIRLEAVGKEAYEKG